MKPYLSSTLVPCLSLNHFFNDNSVVLSRSTDAASYNNSWNINYQLMSYNEKVQNKPTNSHDTLVLHTSKERDQQMT